MRTVRLQLCRRKCGMIDNVIESLVPIILVDVEENSGLSYDKVLFELTEEQKIRN